MLDHKRRNSRGKLKEDSNFKCQIYENKLKDIAKNCPSTELNVQSLDTVEMFCYLGDTKEARRSAVNSVATRIRNRWSKFRDLVPLSASQCLPLYAKGRL